MKPTEIEWEILPFSFKWPIVIFYRVERHRAPFNGISLVLSLPLCNTARIVR